MFDLIIESEDKYQFRGRNRSIPKFIAKDDELLSNLTAFPLPSKTYKKGMEF
jgi:hypothetical protein